MSYPPGPCPLLANSTRCSGVKSVNRRNGSGGRSMWPAFGGPSGVLKPASTLAASPGDVLKPTPKVDFWDPWARQADQANHNPPAASSAAAARDRCFVFIAFPVLIPTSHSLSRRHCARISGSSLSIWNQGGELWCEAPAKRNESRPRRGRAKLVMPLKNCYAGTASIAPWLPAIAIKAPLIHRQRQR